ncbi:MAG: YtxH domain-containing protein [Elusimicrobiota bacterium]
MEQNNRYISYGVAFIVGAAAGAAAGILLAPESGEQTRRKMGDWLKKRREVGKAELRAAQEAVAAGRKVFHDKQKELTAA